MELLTLLISSQSTRSTRSASAGVIRQNQVHGIDYFHYDIDSHAGTVFLGNVSFYFIEVDICQVSPFELHA